MKVKITYTKDEKQLFDIMKASLIENAPVERQHTGTTPAGVNIWYATTCKIVRSMVK